VWLNELFYGLFSFLTRNNPVHLRESYKRHHHYTLRRGQDLEVIVEPAPFKWWDYVTPVPERGYFRAISRILSLLNKQKKDESWYLLSVLPETATPAKIEQV